MLFRHLNDSVIKGKDEPTCVLDAANSLHPNLQLTLEETNSEGNLPFLDLNISVSQDNGITCN